MMTSEVERKYDLTQEEFQKCLNMAEIATFIRGVSYQNPKSIFVVSQAGGGKTGLKTFIQNESQKTNVGFFIEFDPDEIAVYHKYYRQIIDEFPNESYKRLQRFVLPALDEYLRQKAVFLRNNIMQEGTFGSTEGYLRILDFQKNGGEAAIGKIGEDGKREIITVKGGYEIEIDILAVDRFESLLSSYEREQYFIDAGLPPRAVTPENHDRAYFKMLETLKEVERAQLYDKMKVFKRGKIETEPELEYIVRKGSRGSVVECVEALRSEQRKAILTMPEMYLARIDKLLSRETIPTLHDKVANLKKDFLEELNKSHLQYFIKKIKNRNSER